MNCSCFALIALIALSTILLPPDRLLKAGPSVGRGETGRGEIGCRLHLSAAPVRGRAILAPGFFRGPKTMDHLAAALAAEGIETAVIALKRSRPWSGNHAETARDMIALREAQGWQRVTYAGFSAGGLSALIAASEDEGAEKLLMLDPVDSRSLGLRATPRIRVPALTILGQSGPGNANGNATAMLGKIPNGKIVEIPEARHLDFELHSSPDVQGASRTTSVQERILAHAVDWVGGPAARSNAVTRSLKNKE